MTTNPNAGYRIAGEPRLWPTHWEWNYCHLDMDTNMKQGIVRRQEHYHKGYALGRQLQRSALKIVKQESTFV